MVTVAEDRPRAVVLVGGPAAPYSRSLRIARALAAEGYHVEIAAMAAAGLPEREEVAGPGPGEIELRRYRPVGPLALIGHSAASGATARAAPSVGPGGNRARHGAARRLLRIAHLLAGPLLAIRRWLLWPHAVRGWWAALHRNLPVADLYHACGSLTIAPALAARDRHPAGPFGDPIRVIYDAIDDVAESNEAMAMPSPIRRRIARTEMRWARAADAVVTVNDALADRLAARWRLLRRPLVVANLPDQIASDDARVAPNLLRAAAGLPATARIVLFQGRLGPGLGLDAAAEAVLQVPDAALVVLGFGRGMPASRARDADPRYAGRHVTLPAVAPDELLCWTRSAEVALIPLPPVSMNQRLSSPNKFWEALAAGVPVVVVAGLEVMERIVRDHDLGAVAASAAPKDLAVAIRQVLDRSGAEGRAWRDHIAAVARTSFDWPESAARYRGLVRDLAVR